MKKSFNISISNLPLNFLTAFRIESEKLTFVKSTRQITQETTLQLKSTLRIKYPQQIF